MSLTPTQHQYSITILSTQATKKADMAKVFHNGPKPTWCCPECVVVGTRPLGRRNEMINPTNHETRFARTTRPQTH